MVTIFIIDHTKENGQPTRAPEMKARLDKVFKDSNIRAFESVRAAERAIGEQGAWPQLLFVHSSNEGSREFADVALEQGSKVVLHTGGEVDKKDDYDGSISSIEISYPRDFFEQDFADYYFSHGEYFPYQC